MIALKLSKFTVIIIKTVWWFITTFCGNNHTWVFMVVSGDDRFSYISFVNLFFNCTSGWDMVYHISMADRGGEKIV